MSFHKIQSPSPRSDLEAIDSRDNYYLSLKLMRWDFFNIFMEINLKIIRIIRNVENGKAE